MVLLLALVDASVGGYLSWYALHREVRDKDGVLVVGIFLLICAAFLLGSVVLFEDSPPVGVGVDLRV